MPIPSSPSQCPYIKSLFLNKPYLARLHTSVYNYNLNILPTIYIFLTILLLPMEWLFFQPHRPTLVRREVFVGPSIKVACSKPVTTQIPPNHS